jgi:ADP-glucose pyrophosphorylase
MNRIGDQNAKIKTIVPVGKIENRSLLIRGEKVIIDADLAEFYAVPTKRLNEQVKRNADRFPEDFMFQLTKDEKSEVVANCDHLEKLKYSKMLPHAFTEHGAIMAASVLNTPRAIEVSVFIVRAFIKLRQFIAGQKELQRKISQIEKRLTDHDEQIIELVNLIKKLLNPKQPPKKHRIGF